ncbi:MAG: 5,10-methylenetetrahydrofolate reductase [Actinobacteria bacterium RBG_16_64_13]|nr:MAG: 5,10-methylenetetrahydrofolate reductase [Actinobacteria bacterium RBG_16_64_13]
MGAYRDACNSGRFVVSGEIGPPKGTNVESMLHHIDLLKNMVDGLNVTDNQSSVMRLGSLAVSGEIVRRGGDPVFQTTCRDRNRLGLQSDLLSAAFLGITNVLCLTGDHPSVGDHKQAKGVFDFDSVHLIQCCHKMNEGFDWAGNELDGGTDFFVGAVVTPEADPLEPQLYKFARKVEAGTDFFQTQAVYDMDNFQRFMEKTREITAGTNTKMMAGLVVLAGVGMAKYMNRAVPGIFVPDALLEELGSVPKEEQLRKGMEIAARHIRFLKENKICDGVHVMAIGKEEIVPEILEMAGLTTS